MSVSSAGLLPSHLDENPNQEQERQQHASSSSYQHSQDDNIEVEDGWRFTNFNAPLGPQSRDGSVHVTDEVFNSSSHLAGSMISLLGVCLLISEASAQGAPWKIVSFSIYGVSLVGLFVCSTLHHSISTSEYWEKKFQMMDYLAIYPLIAGTFTPLELVFFHDSTVGWTFFGVVWLLSLLGMTITARYFHKVPKWFTMTTYITLGWFGLCMVYWLFPVLGWGGITWLFTGGVIYTIGGYIYTSEQPNPVPGKFGFHEIWHVAVLLGAMCHWMLMYFYVLPWKKEVV